MKTLGQIRGKRPQRPGNRHAGLADVAWTLKEAILFCLFIRGNYRLIGRPTDKSLAKANYDIKKG